VSSVGSVKNLSYGRDALALSPEHTIEFRLFRGTLNARTIASTLEFVDAVCRFISETSIVQLVKNGSWKLFAEYLNRNKKRYPNLRLYIAKYRIGEAAKSGRDNTKALPEGYLYYDSSSTSYYTAKRQKVTATVAKKLLKDGYLLNRSALARVAAKQIGTVSINREGEI
ncbi:MAG: hypothetical protein KAT00_15420, partial [Planctomycetes bacterium]|nr:hypothetical protein [Planctomycetota bacterium]